MKYVNYVVLSTFFWLLSGSCGCAEAQDDHLAFDGERVGGPRRSDDCTIGQGRRAPCG